ncbi:hypothetical protein FA15DRAFT_626009 [Coprinopsis marcescibilis]|uniref:Sensitive to high expression protein 9, mitochondrial n=1 Tax=Coprinopsis marcescibilis TaxID=230819 RepID=A0A5C3KVQ0_COPMA|nr:hypothetical protein FA15DRAFT_626009 [Coprinopsis marcescibilis]
MLRSSLSKPLGRPLSAWRAVQQTRQYSSDQRPAAKATEDESSSGTRPASPSASSSSPSASTLYLESSDTGTSGQQPFVQSTSAAPDASTEARTLLSASELEAVKQRIREWTQQTAITIRTRADGFTATTKTTFSRLGAELNKVTGYEEIEALKRGVVTQESRINETRQQARQAKAAYEEAVLQRSKSQREVNDLLQRKSMWTDGDVSRFTTLVRQDHLYEQEEARAKAAVSHMEDAVEKEFSQLMRLILARYHEEQVWSDKIRSASTYGQMAVLGLNMLVFLLAIILVEPWKRKRLAQTFEKKVDELGEEYVVKLEESMAKIRGDLGAQEALLMSVANQIATSVEAGATLAEQEHSGPPPLSTKEEGSTNPLLKAPLDAVSRRTWELAAVGGGAFLIGVVSSLLLGR